MAKPGYVYIMTNRARSTLYTGVTSDLPKRVYQHRAGIGCEFTKRYNCIRLVYYETFPEMIQAIAVEKTIKAGSRANKEKLVRTMNPTWRDMAPEVLGEGREEGEEGTQ